jgi:pimeloyl-ACP methyl ester carboxylesterase
MIESFVLLLAVLLAVGVIVLVVTAYLMADAILHPPRMTDGKAVYVLKRLSPGDLNLPFSDESIEVLDSAHPNGPPINLAAWWIAAASPSEKCVVLIHGYADAKVGSIAWAPMWHALGYHILAIDLRAHGESGGSDCTAGFFERDDLKQVLNRLRQLRPERTRHMVLFGVSMGAAVALATAAMRDDIAAVVIDSPFADFRTALRKQLDRTGLPGGITARLAIWLVKRHSGANFAAVSPLALISQVRCPIMMIRGEAEDLITDAESSALDQAMLARSHQFHDVNWIVPGTGHLGALRANPQLYAEKLHEFLAQVDDE